MKPFRKIDMRHDTEQHKHLTPPTHRAGAPPMPVRR